MNKRIILLIGNKGLIGSSVQKYFKKKIDVKLILIDKSEEFDILDNNKLIFFLKNHKNIQYIINCSGKNDHYSNTKKRSSKTDLNEINDYLNINVIGVCNLIEIAVKNLKGLKGVINFSSIYSFKSPYHKIYNKPKSISYTISKHAFEGAMKYYASFYGSKKIRFNNVCPGGVKNNQNKKFQKWFESKSPFNSLTNLNDINGVLNFLCSEESNFINGQTINVDGGLNTWF